MTDTTQTPFIELPEDVMRIIMEKCDYVAIQCLRKTCHTMRNFIDDIKPEQFIESIDISSHPGTISLAFFENGSLFWYPVGKNLKITYEKIEEKETKVSWQREDGIWEKTIENDGFLGAFSRDFASLLSCKLPIIDKVFINCNGNRFPEDVHFPNTLIKVRTLSFIRATCQEDVLKILPYICPENLIDLEVTCVRGVQDAWGISQLVELEQWKKVNHLEMRSVPVQAIIQNYEHFEIAKVKFEEMTVDIVKEVKENFLRSPSTTKHLQLYFRRFPDQEALNEFFREPHQNTDNFFIAQQKSWFFRRPDNFVLSIDLSHNFLVFNIKSLENVPQGARVIG